MADRPARRVDRGGRTGRPAVLGRLVVRGSSSNNKAAPLFGPVIVLMLFLNIFAQLILFVAAWIATATHEAIAVPEEKVRFAAHPGAGARWQPADADR